MGTSVVIDANVVIRAIVGDAEAKQWLRRGWSGELDLEAPDLILTETGNALSVYVRTGKLVLADARESLQRLFAEPIRLTAAQALVLPALAVAVERGLSLCDACYAVLAERLDAVLVTADKDLAAATPGSVLLSG
jgi:predicted nucleic acid-binding protein